MKNCCVFQEEERKFTKIKKYEDIPCPGRCVRRLVKCDKCGALFLYQFLEWNDSCYDDYIQVKSEEEADSLNEELTFMNFSSSDHPMIKIGSDNVAHYYIPDNTH